VPKVVTVKMERELLHEIATARGHLDTRSEVVFVLPRPRGKVLTIRKSFYPRGVFRIPSGGIHPGESPEEAFAREVMEETGFALAPVRKLTEVLLRCVSDGESVDITSHVMLGPPTAEPPRAADPDEHIDAYGEADAQELLGIARRLGSLPGRWAGWGRFRAYAHEVAACYLRGGIQPL